MMHQLVSFSFKGAIVATLLLLSAESETGEPSGEPSVALDFENTEPGSSPLGFTLALTGEGGPAVWVVEEQVVGTDSSRVVVQSSSEQTNYRFPLCVYDDFSSRNVDLSVRFKPIAGEIDQAAGLVWRYLDRNNYYVVRANALEDNVVLYKMEDGKRSDLKPVGSWLFSYGKKAPVPKDEWSSLRVVVIDNNFAVWLNGEHLYDVEDETFQSTGKVGLWTKADSITAFDDLAIISLDSR